MSSHEPNCERCASATEYWGMVSLPPNQIYRCNNCGHFTWIARKPKSLADELPQPSNQPRTPEQPQAQQQQQQQPQPKPKHKDEK